MKIKLYAAAMLLAVTTLSVAACGGKNDEQNVQNEQQAETEQETSGILAEENLVKGLPELNDFIYYVDNWYLDGKLDAPCINIQEAAVWELNTAEGVIASGTVEANEDGTALILKDEAGEAVAEIYVENDDDMHVNVTNTEYMQLEEHCHFVREMKCQ